MTAHGTPTAYNRGCRGPLCRAAHAERHRLRRASGACASCASPARPGRSNCRRCGERNRLRARARYYAGRAA